MPSLNEVSLSFTQAIICLPLDFHVYKMWRRLRARSSFLRLFVVRLHGCMVVWPSVINYTVVWLDGVMVKKKTTILVDPALWRDFVTFVVQKYGTAKRTSEELELAMNEYLRNHRK